MRRLRLCLALLGIAFASCLLTARATHAALTAEHRKQIDAVRSDLSKVQGMLTKKHLDEAGTLLDDAERRLREVVKDADIDEQNRIVAGLFRLIEQRRASLAKTPPAGKKPDRADSSSSFEKDVAPILVARCVGCHGGNDPRGELSLETFEGIVQGAKGRLVVPRNAGASVLVQRLTATGKARMPRDDDPLSAEELKKITGWIAAGAKFTGDNSAPLANLAEAVNADGKGPPQIARATGTEKVSFVNDIAPFMVNLCLNCHGGNNPRSGFSLETFEKLMIGGKSGRVVVPGNLQDSRLWQLVGEQNPIKMPQGQARITRTNHSNLRTWIEEGARFDGADAKTPLRRIAPTEEQKQAVELASLSPEELSARRKSRSLELWQAGLSTEQPATRDAEQFFLLGNVPQSRLEQFAGWAEEDVKALRKLFGIKDAQLWRGRLTVFAFKDRFSYSEFVQTNERVEVPRDTHGHVRVKPTQEDVYVCLYDPGDVADDRSPGARALLTSLITEAILQRSADLAPDWATRGAGWVLAGRHDPKNPYLRGLQAAAHEMMAELDKPQSIFDNAALSPADLAPVGYTLVAHMMKLGGEAPFAKFVDEMNAGKPLPEALRTVYRADPASLAQSYAASLSSARQTAPKGRKSAP